MDFKDIDSPEAESIIASWRSENEKIEIDLLLDAIYRKYHYDFKDYSKAHLKRRLK